MTRDDWTGLEFDPSPGSEYRRNSFSIPKHAPVTGNRETTKERFQQVLSSVDGIVWNYAGEEYGTSRTESHYYELVLEGDDEVFHVQHDRCGLEFAGNTVKFEPDIPDHIKWEVVTGLFEQALERRKESLDKPGERRQLGSMSVSTPAAMLFDMSTEESQEGYIYKMYEATEMLEERYGILESGDYDGLKEIVEKWREARTDALRGLSRDGE